jgi:hypothetical protein
VVVTGATLARAVRPAGAADQAAIERAIDGGRDYLFAHQVKGNWEVVPSRDVTEDIGWGVRNVQWGGLTALATLSLLAAGVDAQDPHIKSAVNFLRAADIRGNYALALRAQVWGLLPVEPWSRSAEAADLQRLERDVFAGTAAGPAAGLYGYVRGGPVTDADHSVSQFAVLGMWSLAQDGLEVPNSYWQLVDTAWHRQQLASGGWGYQVPIDPALLIGPGPAGGGLGGRRRVRIEIPGQEPTLSMTAAGVATLFITQEYLQASPRCGGNLDDRAIDAGLEYLGDHLTSFAAGRQFYALFGISRVGLASGYKYLGKRDWFQWGSDLICDARDAAADGGWTANQSYENFGGVPDTAFALLFLARGRAPVMMNKLRYDVTTTTAGLGTTKVTKVAPGTWNQRPRDAANLVRWVGREMESPLNWQVVDLNGSTTDLHDAPILYMAGGKAPTLSADDADKLRTFAEDGGLILGNADCSSADFAKGFRALGERMFPGYRFRTLEANSPILTNEQFPGAIWKSNKPAIEALSNGARELMVLLPTGDPARNWQAQTFQVARREVGGGLMADLFQYAVDKEGLRRRGETYLVERHASPTTRASTGPATTLPVDPAVRVARVRYDGNWDPEPGGWRRLANVLHNEGVAELTTEPVDGPIDPAAFPLADLTVAAGDFKLTAATRSALRDYVRAGGTLLVDVAGGRGLYRSAAEAELEKVFPAAPPDWPVLDPTDPVFAAAGQAMSAAEVRFRRYERPAGNPKVPQLRGYAVGGRTAVFYSREDVAVGLVGMPIDGVAGYVPSDATKVVADVIAYAATRAKR